jgi:cytochrome c oxidase assembly factor CtaG
LESGISNKKLSTKGDTNVVFKGFIAAASAVALMATPAFAAAKAAPTPAVETVEADNQLGGGFIIPLLALAAIIAGILVVIDNNNDKPVSP